jgi:C1A family cysteine protease
VNTVILSKGFFFNHRESNMKNLLHLRSLWALVLLASIVSAQPTIVNGQSAELPRAYDLRKVEGVTPIKSQQGGTCWTHGTMAAIESNLLVSGTWKKLGQPGIPCLSEYHLDWWNGFNKHKNDDVDEPAKQATGMTVHQGGDYRVAAAYISRGDGVVPAPCDDKNVADTKSWFSKTPDRAHPEYKRYYVRDIEWFVIGDNLENIDTVKARIMKYGAIGTAYTVGAFMSKDFIQYQPKDDKRQPNHSVAIAGWDDDKVTADADKKTTKPGAWLIKNSWGEMRKNKKTGVEAPVGDKGYMWISYYDKVCCRDPEMGAVSFRNVEPMKYTHIYFHDYHGWRDTLKDINKAFNVYTAASDHNLKAVSFYTAADNVQYTAKIFSKFEKGELQGLRATKTGSMRYTGFHTVDLDLPVAVMKGETFIVYVEVSHGGQAIDRTSEITVLLDQPEPKKAAATQPDKKDPEKKDPEKKEPGKKGGGGGMKKNPIVISKANPGESYYHDGKAWVDLYDYRFTNPMWGTFDRTANFCMKALAVDMGK